MSPQDQQAAVASLWDASGMTSDELVLISGFAIRHIHHGYSTSVPPLVLTDHIGGAMVLESFENPRA